MHRSRAPLSDVERALRAQLHYTPRAWLTLMLHGLREGLMGLGVAFGGHYLPAFEDRCVLRPSSPHAG